MDSPAAPSTTRNSSTLAGKWSISTNEENYHGVFDTMEEAIAKTADRGLDCKALPKEIREKLSERATRGRPRNVEEPED